MQSQTLVCEASASFTTHVTDEDRELIEKAIVALERRLFHHGPALTSTRDAADYLRLTMAPADREIFAVVFLDTRHQVIAVEPLFLGTVDGASVAPRIVLQRALHYNCTAIIVAHNHPSGRIEPSDSDQALTSKLATALKLIDIQLLDHLIIGQGEPYSFANAGLL